MATARPGRRQRGASRSGPLGGSRKELSDVDILAQIGMEVDAEAEEERLRKEGKTDAPETRAEHAAAERASLQRMLERWTTQLKDLESEEQDLAAALAMPDVVEDEGEGEGGEGEASMWRSFDGEGEGEAEDDGLAELEAGIKLTETQIDQLTQSISMLETRRVHITGAGGSLTKTDFRSLYEGERKATNALEHLIKSTEHVMHDQKQGLSNIVAELKAEIPDAKSEEEDAINSALETPLNVVSRKLIHLIKKMPEERVQFLEKLALVLQLITHAKVYQPRNASNLGSDTDFETRTWLSKTFSSGSDGGSPTGPGSPFGEELAPTVVKRRVRRSSVLMLSMQDVHAFDQFTYGETDLQLLLFDMYTKFSLLDKFKIPKKKFARFVQDVRTRYKEELPYTNYRHAFDVTQAVYAMLTQTSASEMLTSVDLFALLTAALGHDLDHTGFTNDYLVETQTTLACLYNDQSVMESHSCATLMGVLSRKESDLFADFEPADRTRCKKGIIDAILSTDMARHFSVVSNYTLRCEAAQFSKDNPADRQLLINILLHAGDMSNPCRPRKLAKRWAKRQTDEHCKQGDMERRLGLPISPMCDRMKPSAKATLQVDFINFVVSPVFSALNKHLEGDLSQWLENLEANRSCWSSEAAAVLETSKDFEDDGEVPAFVPGLPHVIRGAVDMAGEAEKDRKGKEKHAEEEAGAAPE